MKTKTIGFAALLALALGLGVSLSAGASGNCYACQYDCDVKYEQCVAAGTSLSICSQRFRRCLQSCGCPIL